MNSIEKMSAMFKAANLKFKKIEGERVFALDTEAHGGTGNILVAFVDKGEHFYTSTFTPKSKKVTANLAGLSIAEDGHGLGLDDGTDLDLLFDMMENSKMGEVFFAESDDGSLVAAVWCPNNSKLVTIFVCDADNEKFLGLIGASL